MSESEQIRRARAGDVVAWESLVRAHQSVVFRLAYLMLGDAEDAEDVAQDVFIHAYQALPRFDVERPLRPWLLSIATNLARNRRRAFRRYVAVLQRLVWLSPDTLAAKQMPAPDAQALWDAVRRLDVNDQEIIYLRYFLELSVVETAEAIGVAEGTVKSRLHRALKRLRRVIEREFPELQEVYQ